MIESKRSKKTKKHEMFMESDIGKLKIPTYYTPKALEIDIYLFKEPVVQTNSSDGTEGKLISGEEFEKNYSPFAYEPVQKEKNYFILPIIHTSERKRGKVSGWIRCLFFPGYTYVFTIQDDYIRYGEFVDDYYRCMDGVEDEISLDFADEDEEPPGVVSEDITPSG